MKKNKNTTPIFMIAIHCLALMYGCNKDMQHPVPDVHVDFRINLEVTYKLNTIGGWEYFTGGYNYHGIVVYRESVDEFNAFDRTCTHNISERIEVSDPPTAECTECGSKYLLLDGSVIKGPAKHHLKRYRTRLEYPYLYVWNYK